MLWLILKHDIEKTNNAVTINNKNYLKEEKNQIKLKIFVEIQHGLCFSFRFTSITHLTPYMYDYKKICNAQYFLLR